MQCGQNFLSDLCIIVVCDVTQDVVNLYEDEGLVMLHGLGSSILLSSCLLSKSVRSCMVRAFGSITENKVLLLSPE